MDFQKKDKVVFIALWRQVDVIKFILDSLASITLLRSFKKARNQL